MLTERETPEIPTTPEKAIQTENLTETLTSIANPTKPKFIIPLIVTITNQTVVYLLILYHQLAPIKTAISIIHF